MIIKDIVISIKQPKYVPKFVFNYVFRNGVSWEVFVEDETVCTTSCRTVKCRNARPKHKTTGTAALSPQPRTRRAESTDAKPSESINNTKGQENE